jgi:hypothetical protein
MSLLTPTEKIAQLIDQSGHDKKIKSNNKILEQLLVISLLNPDDFIVHLLMPLWKYRSNRTQNRSPSNPLSGINTLYLKLLTTPSVHQSAYEADDPYPLAQLWIDIKHLKLPIDLQQEREMCQKTLEKHQKKPLKKQHILNHVQKRSAFINTKSSLNHQIISLCFYYKSWRLISNSRIKRTFKRMKANKTRKNQLATLIAATTAKDDNTRMTALRKVSLEISKEYNFFNSEMKKRVDTILMLHDKSSATLSSRAK